MNGISVIIPSKTVSNLIPCLEAVRKQEPECTIHVIDDGIICADIPQAYKLEYLISGTNCPRMPLQGDKPFVFARNCNIGIKAAGHDDIVLLNDDAILETPGGFSYMQRTLWANQKLGLVSATTNHAGNPEQLRKLDPNTRQFRTDLRVLRGPTPGNSFPTVAFVCVMIPRRTIDLVGLLDERFGGLTPDGKVIYGYEDNDYCRRVQLAGLEIGVDRSCFVDHSKLVSSFRGGPAIGGSLACGRQIYLEKWKTP